MNADRSIEEIQHLGGWENSKIANHYIENSFQYKKNLASSISKKTIKLSERKSYITWIKSKKQ